MLFCCRQSVDERLKLIEQHDKHRLKDFGIIKPIQITQEEEKMIQGLNVLTLEQSYRYKSSTHNFRHTETPEIR